MRWWVPAAQVRDDSFTYSSALRSYFGRSANRWSRFAQIDADNRCASNSDLVTQETFLFHDTIYNNILFGRLDATREEVYAAAQTATPMSSSWRSRTKYDTVDRRQGDAAFRRSTTAARHRARCFEERPILLLDEATSALDSESEKQIQLALQTLASGKNRGRDCPSTFHHFVLRSNRGDGSRPYQRNRHPRRAAGQIRLLSASLRSAIQSRRRTQGAEAGRIVRGCQLTSSSRAPSRDPSGRTHPLRLRQRSSFDFAQDEETSRSNCARSSACAASSGTVAFSFPAGAVDQSTSGNPLFVEFNCKFEPQ